MVTINELTEEQFKRLLDEYFAPAEKRSKMTDEEVKEFLMDYDKRFKKPLKRMLIQYYMIVNNSDLSINKTLLEELNFKVCRSCKKKYENNTFNNVMSSI